MAAIHEFRTVFLQIPPDCLPRGRNVSFDPTAAASLYSNLAAISAGVAFTGIVFILAAHSKLSGLEVRRTIICLFLVVFGLFITSYEYATIAAEECENRAVAQSLVAGAGFATSSILAWLGLAWLLRAHTNEHDVHLTSAATFAGMVLIAVFLIRALVEDASEAVRGRQLWDNTVDWLPVATMVTLALLGGMTFYPRVRTALSSERAAWLFTVLTAVSLVYVAVHSALFSYLVHDQNLARTSLLPTWLIWATTMPVGLIAVLSSYCFPFAARPDSDMSHRPPTAE